MDVPWWTITTAHLCTFGGTPEPLTRFFCFCRFELSKKNTTCHASKTLNGLTGLKETIEVSRPMSQMEVWNAWVSPLFSFPPNLHPHIGDVQINYITLKGKQTGNPFGGWWRQHEIRIGTMWGGTQNKIGPKKCAITQYALSLPLQSWKTRSMTYEILWLKRGREYPVLHLATQ